MHRHQLRSAAPSRFRRPGGLHRRGTHGRLRRDGLTFGCGWRGRPMYGRLPALANPGPLSPRSASPFPSSSGGSSSCTALLGVFAWGCTAARRCRVGRLGLRYRLRLRGRGNVRHRHGRLFGPRPQRDRYNQHREHHHRQLPGHPPAGGDLVRCIANGPRARLPYEHHAHARRIDRQRLSAAILDGTAERANWPLSLEPRHPLLFITHARGHDPSVASTRAHRRAKCHNFVTITWPVQPAGR
jgi:hypothetical protein